MAAAISGCMRSEPMRPQTPKAEPAPVATATPPPPAPTAPPAPAPMPQAQAPEKVPTPVAPAPEQKAPAKVADTPKPAKSAIAAVKPAPSVPKPAPPPASPDAALSASLAGKVELSASAGEQLSAADLADTTIYFVPDRGAPHPKPGQFRIYTRGKQFDPATLAIPVGSTIAFPNQDQILHNVFAVSQGATFDLGLYGEGKSAEYTFKSPGLVLINCNVHQAMQANVLVLDTPYFTHPDKEGNFRLDGVPAGSGKLMVWHPRAALSSNRVSLPMADATTLKIALTKPRIARHLNKENKSY